MKRHYKLMKKRKHGRLIVVLAHFFCICYFEYRTIELISFTKHCFGMEMSRSICLLSKVTFHSFWDLKNSLNSKCKSIINTFVKNVTWRTNTSILKAAASTLYGFLKICSLVQLREESEKPLDCIYLSNM